MKSKYKVGEIYGANSALLVLEKINSKYKVQCQICKNDPELHKDAIFTIPCDYFSNGKLPCGCSKSQKMQKWQWEVLIKRKAEENNHKFITFLNDENFSQDTKIRLECNSCQNQWENCSINNYIRDRGCPSCANQSRADKKTTSDENWIFRFRKSGFFPEENFSFRRQSKSGRLWFVDCSVCKNNCLADRSNLVAGKIPCECGQGGGFDKFKTGFLYVLTVSNEQEDFIKFGISNFPKRRIGDHIRSLKLLNFEISDIVVFKGCGKDVLDAETKLKKMFPIEDKSIKGFKKECCSIEHRCQILDLLKEFEVVNLEDF